MGILGAKYKYHDLDKIYVLKKIDRWLYVFECGHKVTDIVFRDLILAEPIQLTLF